MEMDGGKMGKREILHCNFWENIIMENGVGEKNSYN